MIFSQEHKIAVLLQPGADAFNGDPTSLYVSLQEYAHATLILAVGSVLGTGVGTIKVLEATDTSGTAAQELAFHYRKATGSPADALGALIDVAAATGFATAVSASDLYVIEIDARSLSPGFNSVAVDITEAVNDPKSACVIAIMSGARYMGTSMPSCL